MQNEYINDCLKQSQWPRKVLCMGTNFWKGLGRSKPWGNYCGSGVEERNCGDKRQNP